MLRIKYKEVKISKHVGDNEDPMLIMTEIRLYPERRFKQTKLTVEAEEQIEEYEELENFSASVDLETLNNTNMEEVELACLEEVDTLMLSSVAREFGFYKPNDFAVFEFTGKHKAVFCAECGVQISPKLSLVVIGELICCSVICADKFVGRVIEELETEDGIPSKTAAAEDDIPQYTFPEDD